MRECRALRARGLLSANALHQPVTASIGTMWVLANDGPLVIPVAFEQRQKNSVLQNLSKIFLQAPRHDSSSKCMQVCLLSCSPPSPAHLLQLSLKALFPKLFQALWGPEELCQALEDVIFYLAKSHPTPLLFLPHIAFAQLSRKSRASSCASSILQRTAITKVQSEYQAMRRRTQGILSILRVTKAQYKPECSIRLVERPL